MQHWKGYLLLFSACAKTITYDTSEAILVAEGGLTDPQNALLNSFKSWSPDSLVVSTIYVTLENNTLFSVYRVDMKVSDVSGVEVMVFDGDQNLVATPVSTLQYYTKEMYTI